LEIFFHPFGAPLENAYRAAAPCRWQPPRKTKRHAVRGLERADHKVVGNRVRGNGNKFHEDFRTDRAGAFAYNSPQVPLNVPQHRPDQARSALMKAFGRNTAISLQKQLISVSCGAGSLIPYQPCAGQFGLRIQRLGPCGRAIRMSLNKEDMPCELST